MMYQFKIQLTGLENPPVWRRVIVPSHFTFHELHVAIQIVFGWDDYHIYQFSRSGYGSRPFYRPPYENDDDVLDSCIAKISDVFTAKGKKFTYIYDFGDDWKHSIVLEAIDKTLTGVITCVAGEGACPPEDCGGVPGYYRLLEILEDPKHPEHEEYKEWAGLKKNEEWDLNKFDLNSVNEELKDVFS